MRVFFFVDDERQLEKLVLYIRRKVRDLPIHTDGGADACNEIVRAAVEIGEGEASQAGRCVYSVYIFIGGV